MKTETTGNGGKSALSRQDAINHLTTALIYMDQPATIAYLARFLSHLKAARGCLQKQAEKP